MYCHNSTSERGLQGDIYTIYTILSSEDEREPTCQWHVAVARTTGHGWPYLTILSSEGEREPTCQWHVAVARTTGHGWPGWTIPGMAG